jgi:hypothetical protein
MKPNGVSPRHHHVLSHLTTLPRKITAWHTTDHSSEHLLHELCHHCFGLEKAAYFVDNPDFDCLQGVAGYDCTEHTGQEQRSQSLDDDHCPCDFNKQVRSMESTSYKRAHKAEADVIRTLASELFMHNPACYIWPLKHDNYGVLVYEKSDNLNGLQEHLENSSYLFSFCHLF